MAEKEFHNPHMTLNGFQDPMGNDAHQGLELFLDKFHQPSVPSHTIITDPEYYVFLWFHNSNGELIKCPYGSDTTNPYTPKLETTSVDFNDVNYNFSIRDGIQSGVTEQRLPKNCFDLTPFVREATLPEIAPANGEQIQTLFGNTTAGSFSPYASDGSKPITLQILDTEYSILDAVFYPWMKDINSPWWYRPDRVYTEWATPYPMATLEIQRPRMRYKKGGYIYGKDSRTDSESDYVYYSYKFLGVKPTSYSSFEVNSSGRSNLLRQLTMICDMCLVDLTHDTVGGDINSTNLGVRKSFLFSNKPIFQNEDETKNNNDQKKKDEAQQELNKTEQQQSDNDKNVNKQEQGKVPGEKESDADKNPNGDGNGLATALDSEGKNPEADLNQELNPDVPPFPEGQDDSTLSEQAIANEEAAKKYLDEQSRMDLEGAPIPGNETQQEKERGFFDGVMDTMKGVGGGIAYGASTAAGWVADGTSAAMGLATSAASGAVGVAADVAKSTIGITADVSGSALGVTSGAAQKTLGVAGNLTSTVLSGTTGVIGKTTNAAGQILGSASTAIGASLGKVSEQAGNLLSGSGLATSSIGTELSNSIKSPSGSTGGIFGVMNKALSTESNLGSTAFGVVSNVASSSVGLAQSIAQSVVGNSVSSLVSSATTITGGVLNKGMKTAFSALGNTVGYSGNIIGGVINNSGNLASLPAEMIVGMIKQQANATNQIRQSSNTIQNLNASSKSISNMIGTVGNLATDILSVGTTTTMNSIGELTRVVGRMTSSRGNKPTPIESYVDMVTNKNQNTPAIA